MKKSSLKTFKLNYSALTKDKVNKFFPNHISRILLYLRQQRYYKKFAADLLFDGFFKVMTFIGVYASVYAIPLTSASKYLKGG